MTRYRSLLAFTLVTWLFFLCISASFQATPPAAHAAPTASERAADGSGGAASNSSERSSSPSYLSWIVHTSGWIGGVLFVMSIYFVALVIQLFLELREEVVTPRVQIREWENLLAQKDYQGIYRSAKDQDNELAQLVAAGMPALQTGLSEAREAMDRLAEAITVQMEKRISMLAVMGSLGPMIGLLGTLKGMISSFSVIAMSETQLKASEVAGGISEALVITFEGVALSVPAIFFFAIFKNRVSVLSVQALTMAEEFIRRVHANYRKSAA
jgi:biopolymer transport protein ExbB